jgi:hypothetical protein
VVGWVFLTSHASALLCVARDPGVRLGDIAFSLGITERSTHGFVADLTAAGYLMNAAEPVALPAAAPPQHEISVVVFQKFIASFLEPA